MPELKAKSIVLLLAMAILGTVVQAQAAEQAASSQGPAKQPQTRLFQGKTYPKNLLVDKNVELIMDSYREEGLKKLLVISESAMEEAKRGKDATKQAEAVVIGWLMANCVYAAQDATAQDRTKCMVIARYIAQRAKWTDEEFVVAMGISVRKFREAFLRSADGDDDDFKKYNADTETLVSGLRAKITGSGTATVAAAQAKASAAKEPILMCGTPIKVNPLVVGITQVNFKEYVMPGGKRLFPKSKTVTMYYGDDEEGEDGYGNCDEMFTGIIKEKSQMIMCVSFNEEKNDLGLEGLGIRDKSIYRIKRCSTPN